MASSVDELIQRFYSYPEDVVSPTDASSYLDQYKQFRRYFEGKNDPPSEDLVHHLCEALMVYKWSKRFGIHTAVSARLAEKVVLQFFQKLHSDFIVKDISILQPMELFGLRIPGYEGETDVGLWREGDIEVSGGSPNGLIDVKNAQRNSRGIYSNFFVKRRNKNVYLFGVLSPTENELNQKHRQYCTNQLSAPICVGITNPSTLRDIQKKFQGADYSLNIDFTRPGCTDMHDYLPPWAFDYPHQFYEARNSVIDEIRSMSNHDIERLLATDRSNFLPLLLATQRLPTEQWMSNLSSWEQEFIRRIIRLPRLELGFLFALLIEFFVDTHKGYCNLHSPEEWKRFLYSEHFPENRPLGIYDPLNIILQFINALGILYVNLGRARLKFDRFDFKGPGLMRGRLANGTMRTILAYCGGCGSFPLIYGREETCIKCGYLVCDIYECASCTRFNCPSNNQARYQRKHTSAHVVEASAHLSPVSKSTLRGLAELKIYFTVKDIPWTDRKLRIKLNCSWTDRVQGRWVDICEFSFSTNFVNTISLPLMVRTPRHGIIRAINQQGRNLRLLCDHLFVWRDTENPTVLQGTITLYADLQTAFSLPEFRMETFCTIGRLISRDVIVGNSHVLASVARGEPSQSDLTCLISQTSPNAVIRLDEGYYHISEKLFIDKPISITGAGKGKTFIVSECDDWAMSINTESTIFVHGVDLCFVGNITKGILLEKGELVVECSRISGANCANIRCVGNSKCTVFDCEISNARRNGLQIEQKAACTLVRTECKENKFCGIVVADRASITSQESVISKNGAAGIYGVGMSRLALRSITSMDNGTGIELDGHASCELIGSSICRNRRQGIAALGHSSVSVKECLISDHKRSAAYISGKAHCEIQNTSLDRNKHEVIISTINETKLVSINIDS